MKISNRNIILSITAITLALIGLISIQMYLLFAAVEQKTQAFNRNVLNALAVVSQKLESSEVAGKVFSVALQSGKGSSTAKLRASVRNEDSGRVDLLTVDSTIVKRQIAVVPPKHLRIEVLSSGGIDTAYEVHIGGKQKPSVPSPNKPNGFWYSFSSKDSHMVTYMGKSNETMFVFSDTSSKKKKELVAKVVDRLTFIERLPIEQRIDKIFLDSLLKTSLANVGIDIQYHFGIFLGSSAILKISDDSTQANLLRASELKTRLFPTDVMVSPYELAVVFPESRSFVLKEILLLGILSTLFIAVVVFGFGYSIRTIFRQKRFAASIVEFINNMTHEFKTPISTIALATEAIAKPEVSRVRKKLLQYNSIIVDEISRMRLHVEKILQMAVLEEGDYELKRSDVNMHDVVSHAVRSISLQVEKRGGIIDTKFDAINVHVLGEQIHLENIVHNILDNALKYSREVPVLSVVTLNDNGNVIIRISDKGIGLSKEAAARVFEKYFRVSTGNMHNVKGFGLGLSYVKLMVEAHGGTVAINSELEKGTIVELRFPCIV